MHFVKNIEIILTYLCLQIYLRHILACPSTKYIMHRIYFNLVLFLYVVSNKSAKVFQCRTIFLSGYRIYTALRLICFSAETVPEHGLGGFYGNNN